MDSLLRCAQSRMTYRVSLNIFIHGLNMKALFIGGTGTISMAITRLAVAQGWKLYLLNRGNRPADDIPVGVEIINADIYDEAAVAEKLKGMEFDAWCDKVIETLESAKKNFVDFSCGRAQEKKA